MHVRENTYTEGEGMSFADAVRFVHTLQNRGVNELLVLELILLQRQQQRETKRTLREQERIKKQQEKARAFYQLL